MIKINNNDFIEKFNEINFRVRNDNNESYLT